MALAAVGSILRSIFGLGRRSNTQRQGQQKQYTSSQQNTNHTQSSARNANQNNPNNQGKIFTATEDESVNFNGIKA